MKITVKAAAKINLALDIVGLDQRGYHLMNMLMQSVDLYDVMTFETKQETGIQLTCNKRYIPCDGRNICVRCAEAFFQTTQITAGVSMHLVKKIPTQAGMAGGSADGAATLVGLNALFDAGLSLTELCEIGAKIGADIPFCLVGGTAKVTGFGEKIEPLLMMPNCTLVIAKPRQGVSTKQAFADFDEQQIPPKLDIDQMITQMQQDDLTKMCEHLYNALESVCGLAEIETIKQKMTAQGAIGALMTGSGSAVFGVFTNPKSARACAAALRECYRDTFVCKPVEHGVLID